MRNMLNWVIAGAVAASVTLVPSPSAQAEWGSFKGKITVSGKIEALKPLVAKGNAAARDAAVCAAEDVPDESIVVDPSTNALANVVVYLAKKPAKVHPDLMKSKEAEVVFDQKGCRFLPHILVARADQRVRVLSDDSVAHNTHTNPIRNPQANFVVTANDRKGVLVPAFTTEERLPAKVVCDIHNWMTAYWVILDHPYCAVTDTKGEFEIADLPEGDHKFIVWQEKSGYVDKAYAVSIKAGQTKEVSIEVPVTAFK